MNVDLRRNFAQYWVWGLLLALSCTSAVASQQGNETRQPRAHLSPERSYYVESMASPNPYQANCPLATPSPLSLTTAMQFALCNNPKVGTAVAFLRAQAAAVGEAHAQSLPVLNLTTTRLRTQNEYGESHSGLMTTGQAIYLNSNWRVFDFGAQRENEAAANRLMIAALASRDDGIQKIIGRVVSAYFDALRARASANATNRAESIALDVLESANRRGRNGLVGRADVLQAETAYAKATLEKNRMAATFYKSVSVLKLSMGLDPSYPIELASTSDGLGGDPERIQLAPNVVIELKPLLAEAQQSHPAIVAARSILEAAEHRATAIKVENLPTVDLTASYNQNGYPGQGLTNLKTRVGTIGLSINVPLFDGFGHAYKARRFNAEAEQRRFELEEIKHEVITEIVKAHADAAAALNNLEASKRLFLAAEQSLKSSRRRYDLGAADILELLNTQRASADAELERIRCISEWQEARLRLISSAGKLSLAMVREVM